MGPSNLGLAYVFFLYKKTIGMAPIVYIYKREGGIYRDIYKELKTESSLNTSQEVKIKSQSSYREEPRAPP